LPVATASGNPSSPGTDILIGKSCDSTEFYSGSIQNVLYSGIGLSADWMKLEAYQILNNLVSLKNPVIRVRMVGGY
jgi:hypothetical protein